MLYSLMGPLWKLVLVFIFCITSTGAPFLPKERLCYFLGLPNVTLELADANACPLEVFVAQSSHGEEYLEGFQWLSQYI